MTTTALPPLKGLEEHLAHWIEDGIVTPQQAEQIRLEEASPLLKARDTSLVTEALGYVGGVLVVVASVLLTAQVWDDLALGARLALVGAAAVLLMVVGRALPAPAGSAGERLRGVVWALSSGATAFFLGLLASESWGWDGADVGLLVTAGTAAQSAVLWRASRFVIQQAVTFGALCGAAATAIAEVAPSGHTGDALPALGPLAVGAAWIGLAALGRLGPRVLSMALGGVATVFASLFVQQAGWGRFLAVGTITAVIVLALRLGELTLLGIGTVGMLFTLPPVVMTWFPGAVAAPLVLLLCGALLVFVAMRMLRRR